MKISHDINGDSEYVMEVTVKKGFTDKHGTGVYIGDLLSLNIVDMYDGSGCLVELEGYNEFLKENGEDKEFADRHEALDWILKRLGS